MAWGVLEDYKMGTVPGTTLLSKKGDLSGDVATDASVKKAGNIVLIPQPSDSVNDPLNWSNTNKNVIIWLLAFASGMTAALGPMVTPGFGQVIEQYKVSLDQVSTYLVGLLVLSTGTGTFFTSAAALVWGKRPVFVISLTVLLITCVWGFYTTSFASLAVMRGLQGVAAAPIETLVTSTVSDLFFVHQRGQKLAIWGSSILVGVMLGQIISGAVIQHFGFNATFGITALIYVALLPAVYFFVPETAYQRRSLPRTWISEKEEAIEIELKDIENTQKKSFADSLSIFNGRVSDAGFWKTAIKPVPLCTYPAVIFSTLVYGTFQTWLITISLLSVNIFAAPPYNLTPSQIGLTNLPQLLIGFLATGLAGFFADWIVGYMSRGNKGIYEPEFRLTLMIPATILSTIAFFGFGISAGQGAPVAWPVFFMTVNAVAVPFATSASFTYVIDCHPQDANQAFVTINFLKAIFVFVASLFVNGWLSKVGPQMVFSTIGGFNLVTCLFTIPIYVFGKKFRSMVSRSRN
ncbi:putative MFS-type transporter [Lachnellula willkommii]|uniref:Putative MFS-type transporter n=1 Tax=Lachnellula willkommii TaxID=215461 RepID=A0A559MCN5_9HELO|nr:putative MFS-type transporter [Lachnellula willkommii]